jgi:hypothetical protein
MSQTDAATTRTDGTVVSADGTSIAFERSGTGPVLVLVAQALSDRRDNRRLASLLSKSFTVVNYDRRGRGASTDAGQWHLRSEVEDLEALIDAHGGRAALFGASSGAVLALDAAAGLPSKVTGVVAYEAPVIVDDRRPPVPRDLADRLEALVAEGRNSQAVTEFMKTALGASGRTTLRGAAGRPAAHHGAVGGHRGSGARGRGRQGRPVHADRQRGARVVAAHRSRSDPRRAPRHADDEAGRDRAHDRAVPRVSHPLPQTLSAVSCPPPALG